MPWIKRNNQILESKPYVLNSKTEDIILRIKAYLKTQNACWGEKNHKARYVATQGQSIQQTKI